jgi:hypothetical protein
VTWHVDAVVEDGAVRQPGAFGKPLESPSFVYAGTPLISSLTVTCELLRPCLVGVKL